MKIRSEVVGACFDYFRENGFTLISAPSFVQAAVEGGSTLFAVDYFGKKVYLSQSAQFYEEAALAALEKVWIYQPAFRAEKSRTPKHLTEFWMIEAEQAFADQSDNMWLQEGLLAFIAERVAENRSDELKVLGRTIMPSLRSRSSGSPTTRSATSPRSRGCPSSGARTSRRRSRGSSRSPTTRPFFITDYPLSARSFYHMTYPDRPKVTKSADLIAPEGFGELATGGQRIASYEVLMERIKSQDLPPRRFGWYLDLRKYGMPDHAGFGMGVERVTRWLGGAQAHQGGEPLPQDDHEGLALACTDGVPRPQNVRYFSATLTLRREDADRTLNYAAHAQRKSIWQKKRERRDRRRPRRDHDCWGRGRHQAEAERSGDIHHTRPCDGGSGRDSRRDRLGHHKVGGGKQQGEEEAGRAGQARA